MPRRPVPIQIKPKDTQTIAQLLKHGVQQARVILRALALRQLGQGFTAPHVGEMLPLTPKAIREIAHRYNRNGLEAALYDKPRPGAKQILDAAQKQRIIAMVCSKPPEGRARWTVRLITQEAVKRKLAPRAGREAIRVLLQSHRVKPWRGKKCVSGGWGTGRHFKNGGRGGPAAARLTASPTGRLSG